MIVIAYMGILRICDGWVGLVVADLVLVCGKGKPLDCARGDCDVLPTLSSGMVTENMRVIKIVRRFGSLERLSRTCGAGGSEEKLAGVKDLARLLRLRRPSVLPKELVGSCALVLSKDTSGCFVSRGTMCILLEFPR
jgi:hypothetical protein